MGGDARRVPLLRRASPVPQAPLLVSPGDQRYRGALTVNLLPILTSDAPQMSLCGLCPIPGACCKGFQLSALDEDGERQLPTFWVDSWIADASKWVQDRGLDFTPARPEEIRTAADGRKYCTVLFDCSHVTNNGRCSIYDARPDLCRKYRPLSDDLCKFPRVA